MRTSLKHAGVWMPLLTVRTWCAAMASCCYTQGKMTFNQFHKQRFTEFKWGKRPAIGFSVLPGEASSCEGQKIKSLSVRLMDNSLYHLSPAIMQRCVDSPLPADLWPSRRVRSTEGCSAAAEPPCSASPATPTHTLGPEHTHNQTQTHNEVSKTKNLKVKLSTLIKN